MSRQKLYARALNASLVSHVLCSALSLPILVGVKTGLLVHATMVVRPLWYCQAFAAVVQMW